MDNGKLTVNQIIEAIKMLTPTEYNEFIRKYESLGNPAESIDSYIEEQRFSNGRLCPICGSTKVVRNGKRKDGVQKYCCKDCGKSFVAKTSTVASGTRKSLDTWIKYIECMMNWAPVRESAERCGISQHTSFIWRHKILDAVQLMTNQIMLEGIVEADEAYLPISYKGNHKKNKDFDMQRAPRKRGSEIHKRGLSNELVCIPCAVDRNGKSIGKATNLGQCSSNDINGLLGGKIKEQSAFCTDGNSVYRKLSRKEDLNLIPLKGGKAKRGIYHIQHINSYHSELKRFLGFFKGVSTKYLDNYIVWNNLVNFAKEAYQEKAALFLNYVLTATLSERCEDVDKRPSLPKPHKNQS